MPPPAIGPIRTNVPGEDRRTAESRVRVGPSRVPARRLHDIPVPSDTRARRRVRALRTNTYRRGSDPNSPYGAADNREKQGPE